MNKAKKATTTMRKEGYCAYGANLVQQLAAPLRDAPPETVARQPDTYAETAFRLQVCLLAFRECYPPRRVALWHRRLRRFLRAIYALQRHQQLLEWVQNLPIGDESATPGVERVCLRLRQQSDHLVRKVQSAFSALLNSHALNEMRGLSQRWQESFGDEPPCEEYVRKQWEQIVRAQVSGVDDAHQPLQTRWGRLRTLIVAHQLLTPLLGEDPRASEWARALEQVEKEQFYAFAHTTLLALKEAERRATEHYFGSAEPFETLNPGFERLLEALCNP